MKKLNFIQMIPRKKRNSGMSLIVAVPVVALLGMIAYAIVSYTGNQKNLTRQLKVKALSSQLATRARMLLADSGSYCKFEPANAAICVERFDLKKSVFEELQNMARVVPGAKCPVPNASCGIKFSKILDPVPSIDITKATKDLTDPTADSKLLASVINDPLIAANNVLGLKWVTTYIDKDAAGVEIEKPLPASEHYLAYFLNASYEGKEVNVKESTFLVRKPSGLTNPKECPSETPIFRGFNAQGFAICDGYSSTNPAESLECKENQILKDVELVETADGVKPLPVCLDVLDVALGCQDSLNPTQLSDQEMIVSVEWEESITQATGKKFVIPKVTCGPRLKSFQDIIEPPLTTCQQLGNCPCAVTKTCPPPRRPAAKALRVDYVLVKTKNGKWQLKNNKTGKVLGRFDSKSSGKSALVKKAKVMAKKKGRPIVIGERKSGKKTKVTGTITASSKKHSSKGSGSKTQSKPKPKSSSGGGGGGVKGRKR